jgi:hypothetical protein
LLGVGAAANELGFGQASALGLGGVVSGMVFAGADAVLAFGFGSVLVGAGVAVFGQFSRSTCVSPGADCAHCGLSAFFGLVMAGGFVVAGLVCARTASGAIKSAPAATLASNIGCLTAFSRTVSGTNARAAGLVPWPELLSCYFAPA